MSRARNQRRRQASKAKKQQQPQQPEQPQQQKKVKEFHVKPEIAEELFTAIDLVRNKLAYNTLMQIVQYGFEPIYEDDPTTNEQPNEKQPA